MTDAEVIEFLDDIAPRLGLRAAGYRRVRTTVRKRVARRMAALGLDLAGYTRYLDAHPHEWEWLDGCCRITISRFARDAPVFERLTARVLPERAAAARDGGRDCLRVWSAGCACGEEAYSIAIAFHALVAPRYPGLGLEVLGTDLEPAVLARAERGGYPPGCLCELSGALRAAAFESRGGESFVLPRYRGGVRFERADLRHAAPLGLFDVVLCRNVAFTYFSPAGQTQVTAHLARALRPGGVLVVGSGETVPEHDGTLLAEGPCFYRRDDKERSPAG